MGRREVRAPEHFQTGSEIDMPDVTRLLVAGFAAAGLGCLLALSLGSGAAAQGLPDDFVFLRDVDASIRQDIRYAGNNNFVGRRLPGYDAAECVVKRAVARALAQVQRELAPRRLSLKMYDCYRPARAVRAMVVWSRDGQETPQQHAYNPGMRKEDLFRLGYIAEHSGHSTGAAIDLTLVEMPAPKVAAFDPGKLYADCIADVRRRAPDDTVDMGTGYDCSHAKAHTTAAGITPAQRQARQTLVAAMAKVGFVNYSKEWWHFSLPGVGGAAYDFPIAR